MFTPFFYAGCSLLISMGNDLSAVIDESPFVADLYCGYLVVEISYFIIEGITKPLTIGSYKPALAIFVNKKKPVHGVFNIIPQKTVNRLLRSCIMETDLSITCFYRQYLLSQQCVG